MNFLFCKKYSEKYSLSRTRSIERNQIKAYHILVGYEHKSPPADNLQHV